MDAAGLLPCWLAGLLPLPLPLPPALWMLNPNRKMLTRCGVCSVDESKLYSQPQEVYAVYSALLKITNMFTMATAFGNVHGVYKPGNVVLSPHLLAGHQK